MSGDVQPRKRKDKKRRKDETTEQLLSQSQTSTPLTATPTTTTTATASLNDNVNIHVHKDDGTGGGICAKIIFVILFSALAVLIGLIITEHRGLTDLDTIQSDSKFSQIFEGWIDTLPSHEEEHDLDDEYFSQELKNSEEDINHDHNEDDEESDEKNLDDDEIEEQHDDEDDDEQETDNSNEDDDEEEEEETVDSDEKSIKSDEDDEELNETNEDQEESEDIENSRDIEDSEEQIKSKEDSNEDDNNDDDEAQEEEEEEEEADEEIKEDVRKEKSNDKEFEDETNEEMITEKNENSGMAVKIGVGVALLVVAHVVLVKKRKTATPIEPDKELPESLINLSRRNTIVVPPTYQEVEQDIEETVEEDYSDEDGEVDSDSDNNGKSALKSAKLKYQQLRSTYSRSLTPDSELELGKKTVEDDYEEGGEEAEEIEDEDDILDDDDEDDDDIDDEEETEESEDDIDDEELLKRLETRYGKVLLKRKQRNEDNEDDDEQMASWKYVNNPPDNNESDSDKQSNDDDDDDNYKYENIKIKNKIEEAEKAMQNNAANAIKLFDVILQTNPNSSRSLYGKAQALDNIAENKRSNLILQQAIDTYLKVLYLENVSNKLFKLAAERLVNRMRFIGQYQKVINVHKLLIERFPIEIKYKNQLIVTYLTMNRVNEARLILKDVLSQSPNDGFALVHYGFILKTVDNNLDEAINYLRKGINTKEEGVIDGRFYFHLGDALARLGKNDEAIKLYEEGVQYKLFLSKYQRSLYNIARLKAKPWWNKIETPYNKLYELLENNWKQIRNEGLSILNNKNSFKNETENLKDTGDWKQFELFARGQINYNNCNKCPITCKIIKQIPDAANCKRGQTKFSLMDQNTHVFSHCGPTNCRLRVHLGLKVPSNTFIRVGEEIRSWKEGQVFIFDDSFEHEVWHNGTGFRLILIVDVWHPELTSTEKNSLSPI